MKISAWGSFIKNYSVWQSLGRFEVTQSYRRTLLGPWWYVISIALWSLAMTVVYGAMFDYPTADYAGYVLTGMIGWSWISALVTEGGSVFMSQLQHVRNPDIHNDLLVFAAAYKFLIIFFHHFALVLVFVALGVLPFTWKILIVLPATVLLFVISIPLVGVLGVLFVRYRDLHKLVGSAIIMLLVLTPIFWKADSLKGWRTTLVDWNPFYHWIEILRQPLMGEVPLWIHWFYLAGMGGVLYLLFFSFYRRYSPYVIYWI